MTKHKTEDKAESGYFASEAPPLDPPGESFKAFRPDPVKVEVVPPPPPEEGPAVTYVSNETIVRLRELCVEVTRIDKGGGVGALATALLAELEA